MIRTLRFSTLVVAGLLLAGCGGDSGGSGESDDTRDAGAKDPRAGYFTSAQSDQLNPLFADYDTASKTYYDGHAACSKRADRLFAAGKSEREAVQCHLDASRGYQGAVRALGDELASIDGDYRAACDDQRADFETFLDDFEQAIGAYHADWETYASGKPAPKTIQQKSNIVDDFAERFVTDETPDMSKACYTAADRKAASKE